MIQLYLDVELFLVNVREEDCPDANASFFIGSSHASFCSERWEQDDRKRVN
jgi:hypothetical protein